MKRSSKVRDIRTRMAVTGSTVRKVNRVSMNLAMELMKMRMLIIVGLLLNQVTMVLKVSNANKERAGLIQ